MGKTEDSSTDESTEDKTEKTEEVSKEEQDSEDEKKSDSNTENPPKSENKDKTEEKKEDVEKLRKVIKVDKKEEKTTSNKKSEEDEIDDSSDAGGSRESLEQKRAILQSIKDFDFQIKKNQEDIGGVNQKLEGMSKDLDDLVSLYEIVSEQMNPFVGLSKVTKKRLDALENFTKEIETLKDRTAELESFAERSGATLKSISEGGETRAKTKTIDTDALLGGNKKNVELTDQEIIEEKTDEQISEKDPNQELEVTSEGEVQKEDINTQTDLEKVKEKDIIEEKPVIEVEEKVDSEEEEIVNIKVDEERTPTTFEYPDFDIEKIIDMSINALSLDDQVDLFIDEFIESLKG